MLGVADSAGTWRCEALPDGSLGPLPAVSGFYTPPSPVGFTDVTGGKINVSGFWVAGPVDIGDDYHIAYEGNRISNNRRFWYWQRYRTDKNIVDYPANYAVCDDVGTKFRPTNFHPYRAHPSNQSSPGYPGVVAAWYAGGGGIQRAWVMFPDPSNPTALSVRTISVNIDPTLCVAHQGRSVAFDQGSYPYGPDGSVWTHDEDIWYTVPNRYITDNSQAQTFGMENATGYAAVTSSSYSELILFKEREGGLFVQGDLWDPTVRRLPGIPTCGNVRHMPTVTPLGVVFLGYTSGAWLWSGGEAAEHISYDAIDGNDFLIQANFVDFFGRIWFWQDWVVFPNNWMWNWKNKNWWRLEDPSILKMFWVGPTPDDGNLRFTEAQWDGGTLIWQVDELNAADTYQWTSLPLPIGEDRQVNIREVVFVVSGLCTFTFTFTNRDGSTEAHSVTSTSNAAPQYFRRNSNVKCQHLKLKINADGTSGDAGIVHEVRIGIQQDTHYPHGGP